MAFNFSDGDTLDKKYLKESDLIDNYIGNRLWGWGQNSNAQLGANDVTKRSSPVQTISGGINWVTVSAGRYQTSAIKTDGTLWLWGQNAYGQLGKGDRTNRSSPVQTISGGTNWKSVKSGYWHITAIKTDGSLWLWGYNNVGQLGDNTRNNKSSPVQTISGGTNWKQSSAGFLHTAAIKTDGTLWSWGGYSGTNNGILGDDTNLNKSSPVQTISGGTNWKQVSCGQVYTAAIKTDGTLWSWGFGNNGQLGNNQAVNKSSPVQTVSGGTDWKFITTGAAHSVAIKTDGSLWNWGYNFMGQLGDNSTTSKSSPIQTLAAGTNWKLAAAGKYHSAAVKTDGTLWLWGRNIYGQLGTNSITNYSSPVQTVSGGNNWKLVSCGEYHTFAVTFSDYQ